MALPCSQLALRFALPIAATPSTRSASWLPSFRVVGLIPQPIHLLLQQRGLCLECFGILV